MRAQDVWVVASFNCKEGKRGELLKHLPALVEAVQKEPGCLKYECYQDTQNPLAFTMIEHWASQEALDVHGQAEALRKWREVSADLLEPPTKIQVLKDIEF